MKDYIETAKDKASELFEEALGWGGTLLLSGAMVALYMKGQSLGYPELTRQEWLALGCAVLDAMLLSKTVRFAIKQARNK